MKNLKNFAFGLLVAVLAISTQAFTSVEKGKSAKFATYYYGWDQSSNVYRLVGSTYDLDACQTGSQVCVKILNTEGTAPQTISLQNAMALPAPAETPSNSQYIF